MTSCKSYSFAWAIEVYADFQKSHTRATEIFKKISNHHDHYPAWLLAHNPVKWARYKKLVKFVEKCDDPAGREPITKHLCSYIEDKLKEKDFYPKYSPGELDSSKQRQLFF